MKIAPSAGENLFARRITALPPESMKGRLSQGFRPGLRKTPLPGLKNTPLPGLENTPLPGLKNTHLPGLKNTHLPGLKNTHLLGLETPSPELRKETSSLRLCASAAIPSELRSF